MRLTKIEVTCLSGLRDGALDGDVRVRDLRAAVGLGLVEVAMTKASVQNRAQFVATLTAAGLSVLEAHEKGQNAANAAKASK